jgi:hypothetical protein
VIRDLLVFLASLALSAQVAIAQWVLRPSPWQLGGVYDEARDVMVAPLGSSTATFDGMSVTTYVGPSAPYGLVMVHDAAAQVTLAIPRNGFAYSSMWMWDGVAWTAVGSPPFSHLPFALPEHATACYHRGRGRIMALGGGVFPGFKEWDGVTWNLISTSGCRPGTQIVYDEKRDKIVLFGDSIWSGAILSSLVSSSGEWDAQNGWVASPTGEPLLTTDSWYVWFDAWRGRVVRYMNNPQRLYVRNDDGTWSLVAYLPLWPGIGASSGYDRKRNRVYIYGYGYIESEFPAEYELHRPGCGQPNTPELGLNRPWTRPWIGDTLSVDVSPAPTGVAVLATGFSDQSFGGVTFPASLAPYGMPGCFAQSAPEYLQFAPAPSGLANFQIAVPDLVGLVGIPFWQQAYTFDPAANPAGILASNSMQGRIGKSF